MKYKLGDLGKTYSGGTPSVKVAEYWDGNIPWITPKDLKEYPRKRISYGERNISKEGLSHSGASLIPKGAVLMSSMAPIGYVAIAGNDITTNQGFKSIYCDEDKCLNEFIYYWIKNNTDYIKSMSNGSTFNEISGGSFKDLDIELPNIITQKKIVRILSALDKKIESNREQNNILERYGFETVSHYLNNECNTAMLKEMMSFGGGYAFKRREDYYY